MTDKLTVNLASIPDDSVTSFLEKKITNLEKKILHLFLFNKKMCEMGIFDYNGKVDEVADNLCNSLAYFYLQCSINMFPSDEGFKYAFFADELKPGIEAKEKLFLLGDFVVFNYEHIRGQARLKKDIGFTILENTPDEMKKAELVLTEVRSYKERTIE